jgi:hypothetical protein
VLILLVLLPVFAAVLQLGLALYVRNTLAACAQEGARYGSAENLVTSPDGAAVDAAEMRTRGCIDAALADRYSRDVSAALTTECMGGEPIPVVRVRVAGPTPIFGLFGLGDQTLRVSGAAMQELP